MAVPSLQLPRRDTPLTGQARQEQFQKALDQLGHVILPTISNTELRGITSGAPGTRTTEKQALAHSPQPASLVAGPGQKTPEQGLRPGLQGRVILAGECRPSKGRQPWL